MAEKAHGSEDPQDGQKKSRRGILQSTKMAWVQLDEQLPPGSEEESQGHMDSILEDSKKASIQQWLDSGLFISVNENFQQVIHHPVSLPEQGVVQMTVKEYMRSLHHFSETPTLSRGTSFNSYHSAASIPQSIPEWLEFCEKDPVEILLDLGFGADEPDICTQIPARFLGYASAARGINIRVFLEAQKQRMDIENPNLCGRFQQLEILDHVASAFSSLLNDVNILQEEAKEKDWGESVQKSSAKEFKEQRRRMGKLFRKVSKQSIRRNCNPEGLEPLTMRDISFIALEKPGAGGVELSASQYSHDCDCSHLSPLAEQPSLQASDDLTLYHHPCALRPHSLRAAKQMPPCCVFNGSIKERTRKENSVQTEKLKNFFLCMGNAPDSFEMEEVQSFEEETGNPLDVTPGTVGAVNRANSCQSDSSGFLEELPEPVPLQMLSLPGGQRQVGDRCPTPRQQSPSGGSPQDWQQESEESDSRSMMSASFSSQDWSALEEKVSTPVTESGARLENAGGSVEPLSPEKAGYKTTRAGDGARTDACLRQPPPRARAGPRVAAGTVTAKRAWPQAFTSGRAAEVRDAGVRPSGTGDVRKPRQRCPDVDNTSVTLEGPPQRALKPSDVTPSRADVIQTSDKATPGSETLAEVFPQEKPRCSALTPETPSSGSGVGNLPPGADSRPGSSRSVTTQPAPQLPSAAQTAEAPGTAKGRTSECTECDPMTTGPGPGREAKQFSDASVQTYECAPRPRHRCRAHTAQPLDEAFSLGTGLPALSPGGTCHSAHAHCCSCCRRCPHCPSERREPRPAPSACVHCACSHHGHLEAQFTKMLEILQETIVTELSSCIVHEMEAMKTLCRGFRMHLEEIEAHLTGQQTLFSRDMTEEERGEAQQLQTLREALRQQVEELELQLGDRAQQIRHSILLVREQFELLTGKTPEHCPNPHQLNWTGARNAPSAFPTKDRVQAPCSDTTLLADLPPSASGSSPGMSPPAQAESGPTPLSDCPVGGKGMNVFL